jgi:hypothetical protein
MLLVGKVSQTVIFSCKSIVFSPCEYSEEHSGQRNSSVSKKTQIIWKNTDMEWHGDYVRQKPDLKFHD